VIVVDTDHGRGLLTIADLTTHGGRTFDDVFGRWDEMLGVAAAVSGAATTMAASAVLGPPSPRPRQVFAIGLSCAALER
jgi:hypothetical protein